MLQSAEAGEILLLHGSIPMATEMWVPRVFSLVYSIWNLLTHVFEYTFTIFVVAEDIPACSIWYKCIKTYTTC